MHTNFVKIVWTFLLKGLSFNYRNYRQFSNDECTRIFFLIKKDNISFFRLSCFYSSRVLFTLNKRRESIYFEQLFKHNTKHKCSTINHFNRNNKNKNSFTITKRFQDILMFFSQFQPSAFKIFTTLVKE